MTDTPDASDAIAAILNARINSLCRIVENAVTARTNLTVLTRWMADNGYPAGAIADAVERLWKFTDVLDEAKAALARDLKTEPEPTCSTCHQPMGSPGCSTSPETKETHPRGFHTIDGGVGQVQ